MAVLTSGGAPSSERNNNSEKPGQKEDSGGGREKREEGSGRLDAASRRRCRIALHVQPLSPISGRYRQTVFSSRFVRWLVSHDSVACWPGRGG